MKITEPYSPTARANAIAKPVSRAGSERRQDHPHKRLQPGGAQGGRSFLDVEVEVLRSPAPPCDDERQPDEGQRDDHADRREARP